MTSHGSRFAYQTLPDYVFDNPLAFARAIGDPRRRGSVLSTTWERAGAQLSVSDRVSPAGLEAALVRIDDEFSIVTVDPPLGTDACAIVIVGRGDGENAFDDTHYYVVEPRAVGGATRFILVSRAAENEDTTSHGDVEPLEYINQCLQLAANKKVQGRKLYAVPSWYWWHVFRGHEVMREFHRITEDQAWPTVHKHPILLLPELVDAAERVLGPTGMLAGLRQMHQSLRGSSYDVAFHLLLANALASEQSGSQRVNVERAMAVVNDLRTRARTPEIEAFAHELQQKLSRGSIQQIDASPGGADPTWPTMFFDDLRGYTRHEDRRDVAINDRAFTSNGGRKYGFVEWRGADNWPVHRLIDTRWLFPTAKAATAFFQVLAARPVDGAPTTPVTQPVGDATHTWGGFRAKTQVVLFRAGRVVGQITGHEGPKAAAIFQTIAQEMVIPFALEAVTRIRWSLARYWLAIGRAGDAANVFMQTPPKAVPELFAHFPILAFPELPIAMAALGEPHRSAANALVEAQTKLKTTNWNAYRDTLRALVRTLLDEQTGDTRVNADAALALVLEHRRHDHDYSWAAIENEARSRL